MTEATEIPTFQPTREWYEDWPFDVDTRVQVEARVAGSAAERAVEAFLEPLTRDPGADRADGARVHYWGGFTVESAPVVDGDGWRIVLSSAGEDGFDSLESAAGDLVDALRSTSGEVRLAWHELPATRVRGAEPDDRSPRPGGPRGSSGITSSVGDRSGRGTGWSVSSATAAVSTASA